MTDEKPSHLIDQAERVPGVAVPPALTPWGFPRLQTCPKCEYSLVGLPDPPHRCPECGLEYDEFSCEWERHHWRKARRIMRFLASLFGVICLILLISGLAGAVSRPSWTGLFFGAIWLPLILGGFVIFSPGRRFVAITPQGIYCRAASFRPVFIPWELLTDLDEPGFGIVAWDPRLHFRTRRIARSISLRDVFEDAAARAQFADAFREARRRYARDVPKP